MKRLFLFCHHFVLAAVAWTVAGQAIAAAAGSVVDPAALEDRAAQPARPSTNTDSLVYAETQGGIFGTVDLVTGAFSEIADNGSKLSGGSTFAGFGVVNAILYGLSYEQGVSELYSVNPTTGALTKIGSSPIEFALFGSTSAGVLYAVGTNNNLYTIDPATGAAAFVAPVSVTVRASWYSLSTGAPALYVATGNNLYTIDTRTGAATLVGRFGDQEMGAMTYENNVLWGGQNSPSLAVATVHTSTGAATTGPAVTGKNSGAWFAMAPDPIPLVQTATRLTASKTTAPDGATITLTALVTPINGTTTPTGKVEFFDGAKDLGEVTVNGTGQGVFYAKDLPLGANSITARYLADATHAESTSAVEKVAITTDATKTALAASPTSGPVGTPITLTATVTLTSGTIPPNGTVTFKDGAKVLGTATVRANGEAILKISTLKAGTNSITAGYAGDSSDKASTSSAVTVTIT
jgi:hypothetical protein